MGGLKLTFVCIVRPLIGFYEASYAALTLSLTLGKFH
jgi:hypothetical protein